MKIVNAKDYGGVAQALKTFSGTAIYCGRPSILGNPYPITITRSREEAIDKYRLWLYTQIMESNRRVIETLDKLKEDSVLICWCTPEPCHCEVIVAAWKWRQQELAAHMAKVEEQRDSIEETLNIEEKDYVS